MSIIISGNSREIVIIKSGEVTIVPKYKANVYTSSDSVGISYYDTNFNPTEEIVTFPYNSVTSTTFSSVVQAANYVQALIDSDQSFTESYVAFSGITATGLTSSYINNLTALTIGASTIFSGNSNLDSLFVSPINIPYIQPGLNTFTGGTITRPTINISDLNINTLRTTGETNILTLSGIAISANTYYSGSTPLVNIFSGSNIGSNSSTGIYVDNVGPIFNFKKLSADTRRNIFINATGNSNDIIISSSYNHKAFEQSGSGVTTGKRYYNNLISYVANAQTVIAANTLRGIPFIISRPCIIDELGVNIGVSSGNNFLSIGIYDNHPNETLPYNLIKYYGTASTNGTGARLLSGDTPPLMPGLYWATYNSNTAVTLSVSTSGSFDLGSAANALSTPSQYVTWVLGAVDNLPSLWTGSTSFTTTVPKVFYHIKQYLDN